MDLYTLTDLRKIAKENEIPEYEKMSKQALLQKILDEYQESLPFSIANLKKRRKVLYEIESNYQESQFYFWKIFYTGKECSDCKKIYKILDFFGQKYRVNSLPPHLIKSIVNDVISEHDQSKEPLIFFLEIYIRSFTTIIDEDETEILKQTTEDKEKSGYEIFKGLFPRIEQVVKDDITIHASTAEFCIFTEFNGDIYNEFTCMHYLKYMYDKTCVIIPDVKIDKLKYWYDIQIEYQEKSKNLVFPKNYWIKLKHNLKSNYRFIVMPFGFTCNERDASHANMLIYDKQTKELERFDPNGFTSSVCIENSNIDDQLVKHFTDNMGTDFISKHFTPTDFAPRYSIQQLQTAEHLSVPSDPPGFCAAWAYWYANTRLLNPNVKRECLIQQFLYRCNKSHIKLVHFIRNYANAIEDLKEDVINAKEKEYEDVIKKSKYFTFNKLKYQE